MYVVKRDGRKEAVKFDKITARIVKMCYGLDPLVSPEAVAMKVIEGIYDGVTTTVLDNLAAEVAAAKTIDHPDYALLASRIAVSNLHKETKKTFSEVIEDMYKYIDPKTGQNASLVAEDVYNVIMDNREVLDSSIIYDRDFRYDYFGFKTLTRSYLMKLEGNIVERPQQMLLRVAIGIHLDEINDDGTCEDGTFTSISETYKLLSDKYYTHATPTLFNAGTINHTLSSCYLLSVDDSLENIYGRLTDISKISKFSGGVGIHVSQVRAQGSVIASTIGRSEGLVPMLRVFNESTKYVSQGGGKRKGSTAVYVEPWHADIESCILSQKQQGIPEKLCRDLFLALWIPDLFMKRVMENGDWTLFSPSNTPDLHDKFDSVIKFEKKNGFSYKNEL